MANNTSLRCPHCTLVVETGAAFCPADGTRLVPIEGDPLVGSVLAERYRLVRLIGQGGMGRVYEAEHVNITKRLAIKVLHPGALSDPEAAARFRLEARAASKIGHENIVAIDDSATLADGTIYVAMEFLEGESLADRMRRKPALSIPEATEILVRVCEGLAAAHAARIVHRDMKPENIFLAKKGARVVPKILDFGIAKMVTDEDTHGLTRTGAIMGTPMYMSPQQVQGERVDHRSDIYSMGVILFELVTGRTPFKAKTAMQLFQLHLTEPPPRPSTIAPERKIPDALEAVILRALAKQPGERQPDLNTFEKEMVAAVALDHDLPQAQPTQSEAVPARAPLNKSMIGIAAGIGVLTLGGVVGFLALRARPTTIAPASITSTADAGAATNTTATPHKADGPVTTTAKGTGHTIKEAAKTGGGAFLDGSRTVGRTTRDFFRGGTGKAKETWKENAKKTKDDAKAGGHKTREAAKTL